MKSFILEEIPAIGGTGLTGVAERFEWSADTHDAPEKPHAHGGELRYRRTDYGQATTPSFQIMGSKLVPLEFAGEWNDRWRSVGYAKDTKRRFLSMAYRGNQVRITFDDITMVGLIVKWDLPYIDDYRIGYSFTLDPERDDLIGEARAVRGQDSVLGGREVADRVRAEVEALSGNVALAPQIEMTGSIAAEHIADVDEMLAGMDEADAAIETRLLAGTESQTSLQRVASAFRRVRVGGVLVLERLLTLRADTDMQYRQAISELTFDEWRRTAAWYARRASLASIRAERQMQERAKPKAEVRYRVRAGESLYDVSLAVFGTPHNWRAIADRNNLVSTELTGVEDLVIPEVPGAS